MRTTAYRACDLCEAICGLLLRLRLAQAATPAPEDRPPDRAEEIPDGD